VERDHSIARQVESYKRQLSGLATAVVKHEKAPAEAGAKDALVTKTTGDA